MSGTYTAQSASTLDLAAVEDMDLDFATLVSGIQPFPAGSRQVLVASAANGADGPLKIEFIRRSRRAASGPVSNCRASNWLAIGLVEAWKCPPLAVSEANLNY